MPWNEVRTLSLTFIIPNVTIDRIHAGVEEAVHHHDSIFLVASLSHVSELRLLVMYQDLTEWRFFQ